MLARQTGTVWRIEMRKLFAGIVVVVG